MLRLVTWNINSVRLRIDQLKDLVDQYSPDVVCLQETKCSNDQFPEKAIKKLGFDHFFVNGQKGYHGVATLSKHPLEMVEAKDFNGSEDARHLGVSVNCGKGAKSKLIVHNFYVPAGGDIADRKQNVKFGQKLDYLTAMEQWGAEMSKAGNSKHARMVLVGDLNIAPLETDVWSHKQLLKVVSHTPIEVEHLARVQNAHGWVDAVREHVGPDETLYSWWSYRSKDWRASNRGRRLDHIWVTPKLGGSVKNIEVLDDVRGWERPSDHAPVIMDLDV